MNSANSFNICPRCGNSNSLNAKFCSRCGAQLKLPEEAKICPKCHTRNSSAANFCRSCGTPLHGGEPTKICPQCGKEIKVDQKQCDCGYVFIASAEKEDVKVKKEKVKKEKVKKEKKPKKEKAPKVKVLYNHKGGRKIAIFGLIFLVIFTVLVTLPEAARFGLQNFDRGIVNVQNENGEITSRTYLYDHVYNTVNAVIGLFGGSGDFMSAMGGVGGLLLNIALVLFALTIVVLFLTYFIRIFDKRRPRAGKWFMLAVTLLCTILGGLVVGASFVPADAPNWIAWLNALDLPEGQHFGWVAAGAAFELWFFFIYTFASRARKIDEDTLDEEYDEEEYDDGEY